jgi:SAM-dependent methyltransferase
MSATPTRWQGQPTGTYADVLTNSGLEVEGKRLQLLARMFDPDSRSLLESLGLRDGMRCLDVGAGPGTVSNWLARQIGSGEVVALDREVALLVGRCEPNVRIVKADLTADTSDGLLAPASFDLVHVRSVLGVLADPEAGLRRVISWLAPGGILVVSDMWVTGLHGTMSPALTRAHQAALALMGRTCAVDVGWATRLPEQLARHDLADLGMHLAAPPLTAGSSHAEMLRLHLALIRRLVLAAGLLTEADLDQAAADLDDPALAAAPQIMITGWGRRRVPRQ